MGLGGYPNASVYRGGPTDTDLTWNNCEETTGDGSIIAGLQHGGNPGGSATKHILNVGCTIVAAAGAPWQAKLVDLQGYYKMSGANVTGVGSRVLINSDTVAASDGSPALVLTTTTYEFNTYTKVRFTTTTTLPTGLSLLTDYWITRTGVRTYKVSTSYANAIAGTYIAWTDAGTGTHTMRIEMPRYNQGAGCEAFWVVQTQPTAGGPTLSASAYDSTTSTPGSGTRAFQGSPVMNATANAYAARIIHSGNAAGQYGAFLPKQAGDLGIARINSFTWSAGTAYTGTGVVALCICRPLLDLCIPATGVWSERDLVNQFPSLPRVYDGACLAWLLFGVGATTTASPFNSSIDFGWGG
jgi:hypothetical protein